MSPYKSPVNGVPAFTPVRLAFYKAKGTINDRLIRWGTNSPYSHVELIGPDGRGWSSSVREGEVRKKEINFGDHWDIIELPWMDVNVACDRMDPEMGKSYDYIGIMFSHVLSLSRSHPDKWFCSEIIAFSLGLPDPHLYSPGSLSETVKYLTTFRQAMTKDKE